MAEVCGLGGDGQWVLLGWKKAGGRRRQTGVLAAAAAMEEQMTAVD